MLIDEHDIVKWPKHYRRIPPPFYVVRTGDHFLVCELSESRELINEVSNICWDPYRVRRWAIELAKQRKGDVWE